MGEESASAPRLNRAFVKTTVFHNHRLGMRSAKERLSLNHKKTTGSEIEPVVWAWMRRVEATSYESTVIEQGVSVTIKSNKSIAIIICLLI